MSSKYTFTSKKDIKKKQQEIAIQKPDVVLHIHLLTQNELSFGAEIETALKKKFPEFSLLDIDNFSDGILLEHIKEILRSEQTVYLVLSPSETATFNELNFLWKEILSTTGLHLLIINEEANDQFKIPTYPSQLVFYTKNVVAKLEELIR